MKKVYCKNCRLSSINFWGYVECHRNWKEYEVEGKIYQDFIGKLEVDTLKNIDYDCSFYQEKRWWRKLLRLK